MGLPLSMDILSFLRSYPELLLAMASVFLIHILCHKGKIPVDWPVLGTLPSLILNAYRLHDWSTEILRESGGTLVLKGPWFSPKSTILTCDPANIYYILIKNFSYFPKGFDYIEMFDLLGEGIFNADSDCWLFQRKMAKAHMNSKSFRQFQVKASREVLLRGLIPVMEYIAHQDTVVDLQDVLLRLTMDNACLSIFGTNPGCLSIKFPEIPLAKAIDNAEEAIFCRHIVPGKLWKLQRWLRVGTEKNLAMARQTIDNFIAQSISRKREKLRQTKEKSEEKEGDPTTDLLTCYMDSQLEHEMSSLKYDKFLRDTTLNLLVAGRDTTSSALTWFFWLVFMNPIVENKILEELRRCLSGDMGSQHNPRVFDTNTSGKLVYLHAALCESLRLFPPLPIDQKGVLQSKVLPSGEVVRPGQAIMYSIYAMGRMEWIWGHDCLEFKPERWISDAGDLIHEPSYKFSVFNAGPRTCLGKDIAFAQMKAAAATVLHNFHVEIQDGHSVDPKLSVFLFMKNGLMVKVKERCA